MHPSDEASVRLNLVDKCVRLTNCAEFEVWVNPKSPVRHAATVLEFQRHVGAKWEVMRGVTAFTAKINVNTQTYEINAWVARWRYNGPEDWISEYAVESGPKV